MSVLSPDPLERMDTCIRALEGVGDLLCMITKDQLNDLHSRNLTALLGVIADCSREACDETSEELRNLRRAARQQNTRRSA